jgi:hypothetical protein
LTDEFSPIARNEKNAAATITQQSRMDLLSLAGFTEAPNLTGDDAQLARSCALHEIPNGSPRSWRALEDWVRAAPDSAKTPFVPPTLNPALSTSLPLLKHVSCLHIRPGTTVTHAALPVLGRVFVRHLDLRGCRGLAGLDLTPLVNVQSLCLAETDVSNVSALGAVARLDLSGCDSLIDVSCLGRVQFLNLSGCRRLRDVSALTAAISLNLSRCPLIADVSRLGNTLSLNLSNCAALEDVSALGGVKMLDLSGCSRVQDVSRLGNVVCLNLSRCTRVSDVAALTGVLYLNLSHCTGVTQIAALGGGESGGGGDGGGASDGGDVGGGVQLRGLNLEGCAGIGDISTLTTLTGLNLVGCGRPAGFDAVSQAVRRLYVDCAETASVAAEAAADQCAVCFDPLLPTDEKRTLNCSHVFHTPCIATWFNQGRSQSRCPLCRAPQGDNERQREVVTTTEAEMIAFQRVRETRQRLREAVQLSRELAQR